MKGWLLTRLVLPQTTCLAWLTGRAATRRRGTTARGLRTTTSTCLQAIEQSGNSISTSQKELLVGGDFAGYTATYDPTTRQIKPVPEYMVPAALLEWGQHPTSLEIIASEDFPATDAGSPSTLERVSLTVLPEVGCGIDNLDVQKSPAKSWNITRQEDDCVGLVRSDTPDKIFIETIFPVPAEKDHRLRVTVGVSELVEISSIELCYERRFNASSSRGGRADGGGLDAASVNKWMGDNIAKKGPKMLEVCSEQDSLVSLDRIHLPGNVTVQLEPHALCLSHDDGRTRVRYEWNTKDCNPSIICVQ